MDPEFSGDAKRAFEQWLKPEQPPEIASKAVLDKPIPVTSGDNVSHWIVNALVDGRVVGSMDFDVSGKLQRYEARVDRTTDLPSLPKNITEMSPGDVYASAKSAIAPGSTVEGVPKLIAHGAPTKLAWKILGHGPEGQQVDVYVTPKHVWTEQPDAAGKPPSSDVE